MNDVWLRTRIVCESFLKSQYPDMDLYRLEDWTLHLWCSLAADHKALVVAIAIAIVCLLEAFQG